MAESLRGVTGELDAYMRVYLECCGLALLTKGKLLMVGMPHNLPYKQLLSAHQCGDVCLMLQEDPVFFALPYLKCRGPVHAVAGSLPFNDKTFRYSICTHVFAHLKTLEQAEAFSRELERVAEETLLIVPALPSGIAGESAGHYLSVRLRGGILEVVERSTGKMLRVERGYATYQSQGTG